MKKILALVLTLAVILSVTFTLSSFANDYDTSQFIGRKGWKITASCSKQPYNGPLNLVDGRTDTFWHSDYVEEGGQITSRDEVPFEINVTLPEATVISGFGICPRSGNLTGNITGYEFYYSEEDEGTWFLASKGLFANDWTPKYVRFDKNITVKNVRFVITSSHNGYGVLSEFDLLARWDGSSALPDGSTEVTKTENTPAGKIINENLPRKGWKITASDSKHYNQPANMTDGRTDTYWHSDYEDDGTNITSQVPCPHEIVITLPAVSDVSAMKILPRSGNPTGLIIDYDIYVSADDSDNWSQVKSGTLPENYEEKKIDFGKNVSAKKVRLVITKSNKDYGVIAEINLVGAASGNASSSNEKPTGQVATGFVDRKGWKAKASSEYNDDLRGARLFDGDKNSYWHSSYTAEGGTITGQDQAPFYVVAKFPSETAFSGFCYTPRVDNNTGTVLGYEFYVMDSDTSAKLVKSGKMELSKNATTVDFGFNIKGKGIVFKVTEGLHGYGTGSELDLLVPVSGGSEKKASDFADSKRDLVISDFTVTDSYELSKLKASDFVKKTLWKAEVSSEYHQNPGKYTIDGNAASFWHTYYKAAGSSIVEYATLPHTLTVTLPETTVVSGFAVTPRGEAGGRITEYEFYGAVGNGELELIKKGELANKSDIQIVEFPENIALSKVMLKAIASSGGKYGVVAEFDLLSENKEKETAASFKELYDIIDGETLVPLPKTGFSATATSGENSAVFAIDGKGTSTVWHSNAAKQHDFPITYSVDMGDVYTLSYLQYSPRGGDAEMIGYWTDFDVFVSSDGVEYEQVVANGTVELTQNKISLIEFSKTAEVRYIDIEIYNGNHGYAVCGELDFLVPKKVLEEKKKNNYYKLQIGSNKVTTVKNGVETVKEIDVAPYIMNGSTLIPLRGLLEEMGAEFTWDGEHRRIGITKEDTEIEMQIFNNLVYVTDPVYGRVRYTLSVVPQITDSRTFVPVRFISENLGYEVVWEAETQSIYIY